MYSDTYNFNFFSHFYTHLDIFTQKASVVYLKHYPPHSLVTSGDTGLTMPSKSVADIGLYNRDEF
jgi:hypothetical protein